MKKGLLVFFCLMSLALVKSRAQNSLGSPVVFNELRALSGSQFIELYNEGNISGQSISCYTLVIWRESVVSAAGDFYVVNFNDGVSFSGSNQYIVLNSAFLQANASVSLYTHDASTNQFTISNLSTVPTDFLHTGSVENAIFLFRNSASLADALITKNNLSSALTLVNGFTKNIENISTCNGNSIDVVWSNVVSQLSSRNIGPAISGGVAERVNDGTCFGWVKDAGASAGTPGSTNGPVGSSGPQRAAVYSSPTFDFLTVSYETTSGTFTNVAFSPSNVGAVPITAAAYDATYENLDIILNIGNISPTNLTYNIKIWLDNIVGQDNTLDPDYDNLFAVYSFNPGASTYSQTITIPNEDTRFVFIEIATTPGTCYRSQVKALTGQAALPVSLKSYAVKSLNGINKVIWSTSTEQNNKGFEVQRSVGNSNTFKSIGFVGSSAKDGNSQTEIAYSFDDKDIKSGSVHYYRLKQIDFDGKSTYSAIKSVKPGSIESNLTVYPNPSQGSFTLTTGAASSKVNVFLIDNTGRVINQYLNVSSSNTKFNNLKKGFYTLKIVDVESGEQFAQRLVVQ